MLTAQQCGYVSPSCCSAPWGAAAWASWKCPSAFRGSGAALTCCWRFNALSCHGVLWDRTGKHASPGGSGLQKFHLSQLLLLTHVGDGTPPKYSQSGAIGRRKAFHVFLQWDSLFSWCPLCSCSISVCIPELFSLPPLYSTLFFCGCTRKIWHAVIWMGQTKWIAAFLVCDNFGAREMIT